MLLLLLLTVFALADTHVIEGSSVVKRVGVKPGDTVKLEAVDTQVTIVGNGDVFHIDGSGNKTVWVRQPGAKPPRVEREGWDNLSEVAEP
ncbi:MAG: hypothetical protein AB7S38_11295 [Vulcanimicrobiota bacterium]